MEREEAVHYFANKAELSDVVDSMTKIGKTSNEAAAAIRALCEVMDVDQSALEERMVINALREERTIGDSLCNDALELIERLISERDDARKQYQASREECDQLHKEAVAMRRCITRAAVRLDKPIICFGRYMDKRKYTRADMFNAQQDVSSQYATRIHDVYKILQGENNDQ